MRNLASSFTMRKDGVLPRGDWFTFKNKDTERPKVYIYDEIGFWGTSASDLVNELNEIDASDIDLHLNSPGGEIFDGLAIYNALKQHKAKVTVYVDGLAASAASFIAQAGDEVIMARNAQLMIHDGIAFAYGNEQDMLDTAELLSQLSNNIADIYAYRSSKRGFDLTLEDFRALMREEVWYNGKEAVEAGLADIVLDHDDEEAETAKNKWDLSFYNHAGREKAQSPLRIQEKIRLENQQKGNKMAKSIPKDAIETNEVVPPVDPEQPEAEVPEESEAPVTEVPVEEPVAPEPTPEPVNLARNGVMINGKLETDWAVVNQHFQAMQAAQEEQRVTFRTEFVQGLATDGKIAAPMIDGLIALVNGNPESNVPPMSDEQFAAFQASYESAPASSLFAQHAATLPGLSGENSLPEGTPEARADRINVLEGIVAMHRRSMPEDSVKNTKSYIELQSLLGQNES